MKKRQLLLLSAILLSGGMQAQTAQPKKAAEVYMVADAHLDTQWNWDIQTTIKQYVWNTINQNLLLLKQYPDYVFNFEGGVKYAWMKEYFPLQYEKMKEYIRQGRWHISGASWDATDVLVPSTESFIRNVLFGQQYYRHEFGVESTDIFLPDCFGFGWTLPTIAAHCGLIGFSSQKLDWRTHNTFFGNKKYPFTLGLWKGVDGATIMFAHGYDYNSRWTDEDLTQHAGLAELATRTPLNKVYRYYGTGDVGGSPTLTSVQAVVNSLDGKGPLKIKSVTSDQLYKEYQPYNAHPELPQYSGEFLMDVHGTGCYTSQAAMKLYNRQNEILGDAAERASVAAEWLNQAAYPQAMLDESWKRFIFHQFHDDLTGTSIPRAYEFSWNDELISLQQFSGILASSVNAIVGQMDTRVKGIPVVFFNAVGYPVTELSEVEIATASSPRSAEVFDASGKKVAAQVLGYENGKARLLIEARVPATGYSVYDVRLSSGKPTAAATAAAATTATATNENRVLENSIYKLSLDNAGDIVSLLDKKSGRQLVKSGKRIRLAFFEQNKSYEWPAWEILKSEIDREPISITADVKITCIENGALRKTLCVEKKHGQSLFKQYIRLYEGAQAERIDFYNEVDWASTNALLKAEFPLNVSNPEATYDLGIGSVKRGNNTATAYEVYAQHWADLTDKSGHCGVTILNDSKYGWDKPDDNTLRLTLLHTPETQNNYSYQNRQDFGHHRFTYSLIAHEGDLDKAATAQKADAYNQKLKAFRTDAHQGTLGKEFSFVASDNRNVAIKALKKAQESDEYVVRVYETGGQQPQQASLAFAADILSASEADGTEKSIGSAAFEGNQLKVNITPNSIKTYKIRLKPSAMAAGKDAYANLPLKYNLKCSSFNEFRRDANFHDGYSFAAELFPDSLNVHQVPFRFGKNDTANGMVCNGDTLLLPKGHAYNKVYFLAAATDADYRATFRSGRSSAEFLVPSYTGFVGQWGHTGHTAGYLKEAEVAYVGTHRHSSTDDMAYEFTYMFKFGMDIPAGATSVILPQNDKVVIFAATLAKEAQKPVQVATTLFHTGNKENATIVKELEVKKENLMRSAKLLAYSGSINERETPNAMIDGSTKTKWCEVNAALNYADFDLGEAKSVSGWKMFNAGNEDQAFITSACFLQGKNSPDEEWTTLDYVDGNVSDIMSRTFKPVKARYIRLLVTRPTQNIGMKVLRINEMELY